MHQTHQRKTGHTTETHQRQIRHTSDTHQTDSVLCLQINIQQNKQIKSFLLEMFKVLIPTVFILHCNVVFVCTVFRHTALEFRVYIFFTLHCHFPVLCKASWEYSICISAQCVQVPSASSHCSSGSAVRVRSCIKQDANYYSPLCLQSFGTLVILCLN